MVANAHVICHKIWDRSQEIRGYRAYKIDALEEMSSESLRSQRGKKVVDGGHNWRLQRSSGTRQVTEVNLGSSQSSIRDHGGNLRHVRSQRATWGHVKSQRST